MNLPDKTIGDLVRAIDWTPIEQAHEKMEEANPKYKRKPEDGDEPFKRRGSLLNDALYGEGELQAAAIIQLAPVWEQVKRIVEEWELVPKQ